MPLWQRQEVQEMLRSQRVRPVRRGGADLLVCAGPSGRACRALGRPAMLLFLLLLVALPSLQAANFLPDHFGKFTARQHTEVTPIEPPAVTSEYGVEVSDAATYSGPQRLDVTVWRLKDSTSALAFYQWQRATQPSQWMQSGNY